MSKKLTADDIRALANLAQLELTNEEVQSYLKELSSIVEYFEQLQKVDVEGLEPTLQVTGLQNVMRKDKTVDQLIDPKNLVAAAPKSQDGYIKVGRMI